MNTWYVYILLCGDSSYCTGMTDDLERRMDEHHEGKDRDCYTFNRRPVKLVFQETFNDPMTAIEREKQIKGWSRKKKQALIEGNWDKLIEYARSKTDHPSTRSG